MLRPHRGGCTGSILLPSTERAPVPLQRVVPAQSESRRAYGKASRSLERALLTEASDVGAHRLNRIHGLFAVEDRETRAAGGLPGVHQPVEFVGFIAPVLHLARDRQRLFVVADRLLVLAQFLVGYAE